MGLWSLSKERGDRKTGHKDGTKMTQTLNLHLNRKRHNRKHIKAILRWWDIGNHHCSFYLFYRHLRVNLYLGTNTWPGHNNRTDSEGRKFQGMVPSRIKDLDILSAMLIRKNDCRIYSVDRIICQSNFLRENQEPQFRSIPNSIS